jgi:SAM-dependent methyltransferase
MKTANSRQIFDEVAEKYWQDNLAINGHNYFAQIKNIVTPYMVGQVADIGSGGLIHYDPTLPESLTLVDISADILLTPRTFINGRFVAVTMGNIVRVNGDACTIPLEDDVYDSVILNNVAHHLAVSSLKHTEHRIKAAFNEIQRILRPGGNFVLGENCPSFLFRSAYRWAYPILAPFFESKGKPLPYFYPHHRLLEFLTEAGLMVDQVKYVDWGEKVYNPIFPKFQAPGKIWAQVIRQVMFIGRKVS